MYNSRNTDLNCLLCFFGMLLWLIFVGRYRRHFFVLKLTLLSFAGFSGLSATRYQHPFIKGFGLDSPYRGGGLADNHLQSIPLRKSQLKVRASLRGPAERSLSRGKGSLPQRRIAGEASEDSARIPGVPKPRKISQFRRE